MLYKVVGCVNFNINANSMWVQNMSGVDPVKYNILNYYVDFIIFKSHIYCDTLDDVVPEKSNCSQSKILPRGGRRGVIGDDNVLVELEYIQH